MQKYKGKREKVDRMKKKGKEERYRKKNEKEREMGGEMKIEKI